jgi:hypothetical protein
MIKYAIADGALQLCDRRKRPLRISLIIAGRSLLADTPIAAVDAATASRQRLQVRHDRDGRKYASMAPGSLRRLLGRGRLFGWFAENAATTLAQAGPLLVHAGGNTSHARNFRRAKPKNIAGAKPALLVFRVGVARCRQYGQTEGQPRCSFEIADCEQINWHSRPPGLTDVAVDRQRLAAFESIHHLIDANANASRLSTTPAPKICIGDHCAIAGAPCGAGRLCTSAGTAGSAGSPRALRSQSY